MQRRIRVSEVVCALKSTLDPEIGIGIVDIGLVYGIRVENGNDVDVKLTMTSPMCPVISMIVADAQLRLESIKGVGKVSVELVWEPPWNPGMISENYRI
ncbi:MAG: iron-sulfur cluster assembly protein [Candidatus Micrarchaeales archaeon]|jgi:metal-sulfur cluster biosynthetic enzyme